MYHCNNTDSFTVRGNFPVRPAGYPSDSKESRYFNEILLPWFVSEGAHSCGVSAARCERDFITCGTETHLRLTGREA